MSVEIRDEKRIKIPESWETKKLGELADIIGGGTPSTKKPEYWDGNISWITPKDLSNFPYRYIYKGGKNITELGLKKSSAKLLPKGTVLLSSRAPKKINLIMNFYIIG